MEQIFRVFLLPCLISGSRHAQRYYRNDKRSNCWYSHRLSLITDFEQVAMNSFRSVFGVNLHCCHFHFSKCVWHKVQENGYSAQYHADKNFSMHIRMIVTLAYVPLVDKGYVYNKLVKLYSVPEVNPLLNYFKETFIGKQQRNVRSTPTFTPRFGIVTRGSWMMLQGPTMPWKDGIMHLQVLCVLLIQTCQSS